MLQDKYDFLLINAELLSRNLQESIQAVFDLLSMPEKDLQIEFKGKRYHFYPALTKKEQRVMDKQKIKLIRSLFLDAVKQSIRNLTNSPKSIDYSQEGLIKQWSNILAFAQGADPIDHKLEKIDLKDVYDVEVQTNESGIPALPLNQNSDYVQLENPNIDFRDFMKEKYVKQNQEYDQSVQDN